MFNIFEKAGRNAYQRCYHVLLKHNQIVNFKDRNR